MSLSWFEFSFVRFLLFVQSLSWQIIGDTYREEEGVRVSYRAPDGGARTEDEKGPCAFTFENANSNFENRVVLNFEEKTSKREAAVLTGWRREEHNTRTEESFVLLRLKKRRRAS